MVPQLIRSQQARVHSLTAEASETVDMTLMAFEVTAHIQGILVFLLVDIGSTTSIISCAAVKRLALGTTPTKGVRILTATGTFSDVTRICKGCSIDLGSRAVLVDLIVAPLYHYDVILGMDWLAEMRAEIDYEARVVIAHGPEGTAFTFLVQVSHPSRLSCYASLLASTDSPILRNMPVVQDFEDVFRNILGLPPQRENDFTIDLVPGATPISLPTYRMPPC
ncbi:uncharacterized protein LOC131217457 [Magnolia sinica]|uniref:uncharacterized protein LOC131217457 n=1 Tax=Magnolia sinica TaxID=86752 RepID=UPI0026581FD5|nr:uncharacterized protein LOC131217457 [Magnolia sinica]